MWHVCVDVCVCIGWCWCLPRWLLRLFFLILDRVSMNLEPTDWPASPGIHLCLSSAGVAGVYLSRSFVCLTRAPSLCSSYLTFYVPVGDLSSGPHDYMVNTYQPLYPDTEALSVSVWERLGMWLSGRAFNLPARPGQAQSSVLQRNKQNPNFTITESLQNCVKFI